VNEIVYAGNGKTNNNRATITFNTPLKGTHDDYAFLVSVAIGALGVPQGGHVCGYNMAPVGTVQYLAGFDVCTDQPSVEFSWIVVQLKVGFDSAQLPLE
jgi:hypothetical protein